MRVLAIADDVPQFVAVVAVQSVFGTDPDEACGILLDRGDAALRKTRFGADPREQHLVRRRDRGAAGAGERDERCSGHGNAGTSHRVQPQAQIHRILHGRD